MTARMDVVKYLERIADVFSLRSRSARAKFLMSLMEIDPNWRVLDLGGGSGEHINRVFPWLRDVTVCDFNEEDLAIAKGRFCYKTVLLDASEVLPFTDKSFDLVFCSSVIEHVTGPKEEVLDIEGSEEFRDCARKYQLQFAREIDRIAKAYYVQTPHRHFIIESHSWLPWPLPLLPRPVLKRLLWVSGRILPKRTDPDWHLLDRPAMQMLFPEAACYIERRWGLPKSLMAVRCPQS